MFVNTHPRRWRWRFPKHPPARFVTHRLVGATVSKVHSSPAHAIRSAKARHRLEQHRNILARTLASARIQFAGVKSASETSWFYVYLTCRYLARYLLAESVPTDSVTANGPAGDERSPDARNDSTERQETSREVGGNRGRNPPAKRRESLCTRMRASRYRLTPRYGLGATAYCVRRALTAALRKITVAHGWPCALSRTDASFGLLFSCTPLLSRSGKSTRASRGFKRD